MQSVFILITVPFPGGDFTRTGSNREFSFAIWNYGNRTIHHETRVSLKRMQGWSMRALICCYVTSKVFSTQMVSRSLAIEHARCRASEPIVPLESLTETWSYDGVLAKMWPELLHRFSQTLCASCSFFKGAFNGQ